MVPWVQTRGRESRQEHQEHGTKCIEAGTGVRKQEQETMEREPVTWTRCSEAETEDHGKSRNMEQWTVNR